MVYAALATISPLASFLFVVQPYQSHEGIQWVGRASSYLLSVLNMVVVLTPFIMVGEKLGIVGALKRTSNFIVQFFAKYATLIVICVFILSIPSFFTSVVKLTMGIGPVIPLFSLISVKEFVLDSTGMAVTLFLSIVVYIAIFHFYSLNRREISPEK